MKEADQAAFEGHPSLLAIWRKAEFSVKMLDEPLAEDKLGMILPSGFGDGDVPQEILMDFALALKDCSVLVNGAPLPLLSKPAGVKLVDLILKLDVPPRDTDTCISSRDVQQAPTAPDTSALPAQPPCPEPPGGQSVPHAHPQSPSAAGRGSPRAPSTAAAGPRHVPGSSGGPPLQPPAGDLGPTARALDVEQMPLQLSQLNFEQAREPGWRATAATAGSRPHWDHAELRSSCTSAQGSFGCAVHLVLPGGASEVVRSAAVGDAGPQPETARYSSLLLGLAVAWLFGVPSVVAYGQNEGLVEQVVRGARAPCAFRENLKETTQALMTLIPCSFADDAGEGGREAPRAEAIDQVLHEHATAAAQDAHCATDVLPAQLARSILEAGADLHATGSARGERAACAFKLWFNCFSRPMAACRAITVGAARGDARTPQGLRAGVLEGLMLGLMEALQHGVTHVRLICADELVVRQVRSQVAPQSAIEAKILPYCLSLLDLFSVWVMMDAGTPVSTSVCIAAAEAIKPGAPPGAERSPHKLVDPFITLWQASQLGPGTYWDAAQAQHPSLGADAPVLFEGSLGPIDPFTEGASAVPCDGASEGPTAATVDAALARDPLVQAAVVEGAGSRNDDDAQGQCAVCLEAMFGCKLGCLLPCGHVFHMECAALIREDTETCPLCKANHTNVMSVYL